MVTTLAPVRDKYERNGFLVLQTTGSLGLREVQLIAKCEYWVFRFPSSLVPTAQQLLETSNEGVLLGERDGPGTFLS